MIRTINSFKKIILKPNSLVVLDIDETILGFPTIPKNWWNNVFGNYYLLTNDFDLAEKLALKDWTNRVKNAKPIKLESKQLDIFLDKVNNLECPLLILTARNPILTEITIKHLASIGFDHSNVVHDKNKGSQLLKLVQTKYSHIDNIVFVDDLLANLEDVQFHFKNHSDKYKLELYNIIHDLDKYYL
jgi:hypothetical protein